MAWHGIGPNVRRAFVLAAIALIQPWYGATGDMAWVMVVGIAAILVQEGIDTRKKKS